MRRDKQSTSSCKVGSRAVRAMDIQHLSWDVAYKLQFKREIGVKAIGCRGSFRLSRASS